VCGGTADLEKGGYRINVIRKRVKRKGPFTSFDLVLQLKLDTSRQLVKF
jgi:hypothetical protein